MFSCNDDPLTLQKSLESFIDEWFQHEKPWSGVDEEKLNEVELPQPLKWLYGFAGEWHGKPFYWSTLFAHQDSLRGMEYLRKSEDGKLIFLDENQGMWQVATEPTGENPPVWYRYEDNGEWWLVDESLSRFLVTFILFDSVCGCRFHAHGENLIEKFKEAGMHVAPLWLNGPYTSADEDGTGHWTFSFYLADGKYLIMKDDFCGTNIDEPWKQLPDIFQKERVPSTLPSPDTFPLPKDYGIPPMVQKSILERKIREHEEQAKYHSERGERYRKVIQKLNQLEADQ
ncbi:MAG: hypothetical protein KDA65_06950 [Planctomycetaceae bacterium]|nr:hypothetical protein [Planctomycetaceae bacterium]